MVDAVVGDRIVQPDERLAADFRIDPLHVLNVDHIDHGVSGPHHLYGRIHHGYVLEI